MPWALKGKLYKAVVLPVMLYLSGTLSIKTYPENELGKRKCYGG